MTDIGLVSGDRLNGSRSVALIGLLAACLFCLFLALPGCSKKEEASTFTNGFLALKLDGAETEIKIEGMDIFLVDSEYEGRYPETFLIFDGTTTELLGEFPKDLEVGYDENFEKMVGRSIAISPSGEPEGDTIPSHIALPSKGDVKVKSGTFSVNKIRKDYAKDGGRILEGTITLKLEDNTEVKGTFVFAAKTWG